MRKPFTWMMIATLCLAVALASPALAGSKKRQKEVGQWPKVDLSAYPVLCIEEFEVTDPKAAKRKKAVLVKSAPKRIADYLEQTMTSESFEQVLRGPMDEAPPPGTVVLRGEITQYKPGSAMGRAMLAGAGSAHLDFKAELVSAETGEVLSSFGDKKTWAWGGAMGMSKGIEDLEQNLAHEIVMYLHQVRTGEPL